MLLNWKMNTIKEYIPFYKRNLKIALPIVFSQLGGAVVQLVDTFMVVPGQIWLHQNEHNMMYAPM